jgi:hypothetical protein
MEQLLEPLVSYGVSSPELVRSLAVLSPHEKDASKIKILSLIMLNLSREHFRFL